MPRISEGIEKRKTYKKWLPFVKSNGIWVRETTHAGRIQVVHRAPLARLIRLTLFWKEQSFKLFLFLHRFSVTARWVVFAKKKTVEQFLKNKKNALRILNLLSGVLGRCILSFFARTEFHSSDFPPPPLGQNNARCLFVRLLWMRKEKSCIFSDRD